MKRIELEKIKELLYKMYPDQIFDFTNYKNTSSKIRLVDPIYGEWFPTAHNLLSKKRQHRNAQIRGVRTSMTEVKNRLLSMYGDLIIIDETTYSGVNNKCKFIDKEYGEFWARPYHVFRGMRHKKRAIVENGISSRLSIEDVKNRLKKIGSKITIDESTYSGLYRKARFIHEKYGEWWATPNNVIMHNSSHPDGARQKSIDTFMRNYGTVSPMQNKEIFLKNAKSRWRKMTLKHWRTGKNVVCTSSYEFAVVRHLNENKIDYDWQIKFVLPNGYSYFIDMYLPDKNKYVEIKGIFFNEKNKKKWEIFHSLYKNSEIWFIDEVVEFVGKSEYKIKKEFSDIYHGKKTQ
jgi:hypothetical protein